VIRREIFHGLREKHGNGFEDFIQEKVFPLAGDIVYKNLGLDNEKLTELSKEIDIIVNGAATTNFYERSENFFFVVHEFFEIASCQSIWSIFVDGRYDVAFDTNVMGAKHICEFAKRCDKLKMLLHVSTGRI
jgi:fatty acyl-CoA reductase